MSFYNFKKNNTHEFSEIIHEFSEIIHVYSNTHELARPLQNPKKNK